jgi:hypothetical protein
MVSKFMKQVTRLPAEVAAADIQVEQLNDSVRI